MISRDLSPTYCRYLQLFVSTETGRKSLVRFLGTCHFWFRCRDLVTKSLTVTLFTNNYRVARTIYKVNP